MSFGSTQFIKKGFFLLLISQASAALAVENETELQKILERPLITGASVSADSGSLSPGKKLALQYTSKANIRTIAFGGRPGAETIKCIQNKDLTDRTSILALDFLFWDSTLKTVERSLEALEELQKKAKERNLPLVVGAIPELLPGQQTHRVRLNQAIQERCSEDQNCFVMPLDELHQQVMRDGYLLIEGKKYTLKEIVPDGLHLSDAASEELARRLKAVLMR